jgi:hypothetical protein
VIASSDPNVPRLAVDMSDSLLTSPFRTILNP